MSVFSIERGDVVSAKVILFERFVNQNVTFRRIASLVVVAIIIQFVFTIKSSEIPTINDHGLNLIEISYTPLEITQSRTNKTSPFIVKKSDIESKRQLQDLEIFGKAAIAMLASSGDDCMHMSNYGINHNIIVIGKTVMIESESKTTTGKIYETSYMSFMGELKTVKYYQEIQVSYIGTDLNTHTTILRDNDAACFATYQNVDL